MVTEADLERIPPPARKLTAIGNRTTEAVFRLFSGRQRSLFPRKDIPDLTQLAQSFEQAGWEDKEAARLIDLLAEVMESEQEIDVRSLAKWVAFHPNDADSIKECMELNPPEELNIIRILSRRGSQKIVFLATWNLTQQEVVVKKLIKGLSGSERILARELQPHPLSMVHENIIETHLLKNNDGEPFLVERRLSLVLDDPWRANGVHEASDLLFSIAKGVKFLHDSGLVHGDVKPDNIGKRDDTFVLLDFGICRPKEAFSRASTPTGSIRTRAPELLVDEAYLEPEKVDIWALGATLFNSLVGRFPLIKNDEAIPRVSSPLDRSAFEAELRVRVGEWSQWVNVQAIPEPLNKIIEKMLALDPKKRPSAGQVVEMAQTELSAFLRSSIVNGKYSGGFSPLEEFVQIQAFLRGPVDLASLPPARQLALRTKLEELERARGFSTSEIVEIKALINQVAVF